jgi:DNA-directed RNA polymerase subunit N (RpoN/RPB10)
MACPIQCFTCGRNLAELHPAFIELYEAHVKKDLQKSDIDPSKYGIVEGEVGDIIYIYEFLQIRSLCCRMRIKNFRDDEGFNFKHVGAYK